MRGKLLETIVAALQSMVGGYFVWRDTTGAEFVIMSKQEFDRLENKVKAPTQLPLVPRAQNTAAGEIAGQTSEADEVLERINHELAEYQALQEEILLEIDGELADDIPSESAEGEDKLRVRFEPLRGDLPPELQE